MALTEQKQPIIDVPDADELRRMEKESGERKEREAQRQRELHVIDSNYLLEGEAYNRESIEAEIVVHGQIIGEQFYHVGRKLILLKEHEGHGYFLDALKRLGIAQRSARRWMNCALVAQKTKSAKLADLSQQKLLELGNLSDGELDALGEGQTVAGLHLDELDKMSYSELKTQVRGHKAELQAQETAFEKVFAQKDKALTEKDSEILQLEKQLASPTAQEGENRLRAAIGRQTLEMSGLAMEARLALEAYRRSMIALCAIRNIEFAHLQERELEISAELEMIANALDSCSGEMPLSPRREEHFEE